MGFKMKGMSGLSSSDTPILKKNLGKNIIAEANRDGSIYLDKSVKKNSAKGKEAIAHEKVHLDQMKRGDLDYDDNSVMWKGKKYSRKKMKEGAENLPWEKEAYDKTSRRRRRRNGKRRR
tara:strand:+ start:242 stop:598 length:357 start_codon:yes stop_codon:yes gene_type:complete